MISFDKFKLLPNRKVVYIYVDGFKNPLEVEYAFYFLAINYPFLVWRVIDTQHIFSIDLKIVIKNHNEKYEEHFKLVLSKLRNDIIDWIKELRLKYNIRYPDEVFDLIDKDDWRLKYYLIFKNYLYI